VSGSLTVMASTVRELADAVPPRLLTDVVGSGDDAVTDLTHDSRQVRPGSAFACVTGEHFDGHEFAATAVELGAVLLLVERALPIDVPQIVVTDVRRAMGHAAAAVHGHPSAKLRMIGITGTNGKTTTTHLLGSILGAAGYEQRQLGTLSGVRTTPEAPDLQRQLAEFVEDGVDAVVMEVSSHALALHRVAGTRFAAAVFTNLGRDHLDLHGSMESYFRAKASLFDPELTEIGVTNLDDPYGRLVLDVAAVPIVGFSWDDAVDVQVEVDHHSFDWHGHRVSVPIGGRFNVMNTLAALTVAEALGIEIEATVRGLAACPPVPGRFELVSDPGAHEFAVVVDYAHTPDGLAELLESARTLAGAGRVIIVFGCGGDRDGEKRPLMGAVAAQHADLVVITSDNPRNEDPAEIIRATIAGVDARRHDAVQTEIDRRAAIAIAIGLADPGDVVVIAGKGHETTQTIGDDARPFDDRTVARELLVERSGGASSADTGGRQT
jgi:UDP-N-acetylmuramoyl-L-alanyl-D-glutamate--2,6-diaminopimelate ligase